MMSKESYIKERDKLYAEMVSTIHAEQKRSRANSPETTQACQERLGMNINAVNAN